MNYCLIFFEFLRDLLDIKLKVQRLYRHNIESLKTYLTFFKVEELNGHKFQS